MGERSANAEHAVVEKVETLDTAQAWQKRRYEYAFHFLEQRKEHPRVNKDVGVGNEFLCLDSSFSQLQWCKAEYE